VSGGKEVASLAGHTNDVRSVAFSPDGQHIVSWSEDKLVTVWSVSARMELAGHASIVRSVAFSPDGQHIVSRKLEQLGEGVVCACEEGGCVAGLETTSCVHSVAFSFDGQHIVSGSDDRL
jgi:WD40 repeat protein